MKGLFALNFGMILWRHCVAAAQHAREIGSRKPKDFFNKICTIDVQKVCKTQKYVLKKQTFLENITMLVETDQYDR